MSVTREFFGGALVLTFEQGPWQSDGLQWYCTTRNAERYPTLQEAIRQSLRQSITCRTCDYLMLPGDDDSMCSDCEQCPSCCECWTCEHASRRQYSHRCTEEENRCESCERCETHCHCSVCEDCGARGEDLSICSNCSRCNECCNCCRCQDCDGVCGSDDWCGDCDRCNECCRCWSRIVEFFDSPLTFHFASKKQYKRNPSKRFLSCELEIDHTNSDDCDRDITRTVKRWNGSIVRDGSLDGETGFEINTAPAQGDVFCEQIETICDALQLSGAQVDSSCGYHVHVDARDYGYFEVRKLILLYEHIEDALFQMVPPCRRHNTACNPCGHEYASTLQTGKLCKKSIVKTLYKTTSRSVKVYRNNKYTQIRYHALNLHSWFFRGTVECRLAAGSANADKVIPWAMLWADIIDYCHRETEAEVMLTRKLKSSYDTMIQDIATTEEVRLFIAERTKKFSGK